MQFAFDFHRFDSRSKIRAYTLLPNAARLPNFARIPPMKLKALLPLGLCFAVVALTAGCATQKTRTGRNTNIGAGLVTVNTGSYEPVSPATLNFNTNEAFGDMSQPSGTEVKILWGLITLHDY